MKRLSDIIAGSVREAVGALEVLATDKDAIEWEVIPFLGADSSVNWLIGIGLPVPASGDSVMPFALLSDPHDPGEVSRVVRTLHEAAAGQVLDATARARRSANGHRESPGGLLLP